MYICNLCGDTKEELNTAKNWSECGNQMVCEVVSDDSCSCGGNYEEAETCPLCGEYITADKILCDDCVESETTVETALEHGEVYKEVIELNGFLTTIFPASVIERILKEVLENSLDKGELARRYCAEDDYCFREFLIEKAEEKK